MQQHRVRRGAHALGSVVTSVTVVTCLIAGLLTCLLTGLVATAGPSAAHAKLASSNPAEGKTVTALPDAVELTFTEVVGRPASVAVTGPGDVDVAQGEAEVLDDVLTQKVDPTDAPAGEYAISYQVVSADGHTISGELRFALGGAGVQAAAGNGTPAAEAPDGGVSTPVVIALLLTVAGALGAMAFGLARLVGNRGD